MRWVKLDGVQISPSPRMGISELHILLPTKNEKLDEVKKLISGKFEIIIQRQRKDRSLTANAYMWALCDELAKVLKISKEEVYRRAIKQVGVYESLSMQSVAYERFKQAWEGRGTGWVVDMLMNDGVRVQCNAYYGSSTYNSVEMARLIDWIVEECKEQGIDTLTERERSLLIDRWSKKSGKEVLVNA